MYNLCKVCRKMMSIFVIWFIYTCKCNSNPKRCIEDIDTDIEATETNPGLDKNIVKLKALKLFFDKNLNM